MKSSAIATIKQIKKQFEKKLAIRFFWVYNWYVEKKGKNMIEKISHFICGVAVFMSLVAGVVVLVSHNTRQMNQYAVENDCRWSGGFCYTESDRPWLFK